MWHRIVIPLTMYEEQPPTAEERLAQFSWLPLAMRGAVWAEIAEELSAGLDLDRKPAPVTLQRAGGPRRYAYENALRVS